MLRALWRSGRFRVSVSLIALLVGVALVGPNLSDANPRFAVGGRYNPPSAGIWLGTDAIGNDVFVQLMHGLGTSLYIGLVAGAVATAIGVVIGTLSGYLGGFLDELLMGLTNILITVPTIVILVLLSVALQNRSTLLLGVIIGVTSWPWTARAVRAQTSSLKVREHIDIARLSGAGTGRIIGLEILPYMASYVVMAFVLQLSNGVLNEAALSLLGLGPSQSISLGRMLQSALQGEALRVGAYWAILPQTVLLALIAFSLLLLQSSLDEFFNPRLRRR
jgi:peptide/nickel transport system permease protein